MSTFEFPDDLIDLQRRFLAADARCDEVAASLPRGIDIANGEAELSDEQRETLGRARAEKRDLAGRLSAHGWWLEVPAGDRYDARVALRAAATG